MPEYGLWGGPTKVSAGGVHSVKVGSIKDRERELSNVEML